MDKEHSGIFHEGNFGYIFLGIVLLVLGFVASLFFVTALPVEWALTILLPGVAVAVICTLLFEGFVFTNQRRSAGSTFIRALAVLSVSAAIIMGATVGLSWLSDTPFSFGEQLYVIISLTALVALGFYTALIPAPTAKGAEKIAEIEGLKTYLTYTEKDRMAMTGAPQMSPQHFETLLPFAMALGVEKHWNKSFDNWLKSASAKEQGYRHDYQNSWSRGDYRAAAAAGIGTVMASSLASAMPVEKSSSSSSSSGGGGGGGGGGGW